MHGATNSNDRPTACKALPVLYGSQEQMHDSHLPWLIGCFFFFLIIVLGRMNFPCLDDVDDVFL